MIKIYWLECSYYDHPWKYSLILYTSWCNFRCYSCHNRTLSWRDYIDQKNKIDIKYLDFKDYYKEILDDELKMAIKNKMLDMVILCWWEFLIFKIEQIKEFIDYIKSLNSNVLIRVDTNGSFPEKVSELINRWKVDGFAIDIKWPYWNYNYYDTISKIIWIPLSIAWKVFERITESLNLSKILPYTIYRTVSYPIVKDISYFNEIKQYVQYNLKKPHSFNTFINL